MSSSADDNNTAASVRRAGWMAASVALSIAIGVALSAIPAGGATASSAGSNFGSRQVQDGTPPDLALGKEVYESQCQPCHGSEGKGDGPAARFLESRPRDLTAGEWKQAKDGSVAAVAKVIAGGIDGTEMEPFDELLEPDEIWAAAAYVAARFVPRKPDPR